MSKIRIIIADDEKLIRQGLKIILESYGDIEVVAEATDGNEALEQIRRNSADLILMDIRMPDCDGVQATRNIRREFSQVKILILTTFSDTEHIQEAMKFGASGYLLKDSDHDVIYEGIKASVKGNVVIHPKVASAILSDRGPKVNVRVIDQYDLNEKDLELIGLVAGGYSNREISEKLFLSEGTIKNQISALLARLDLRDRTQLTIFAFRNGLAE